MLITAAAVFPAFILGVLYSRILRCIEACGKRTTARNMTIAQQSVTGVSLEPHVATAAVIGAPLSPILEGSPVFGTPVLTPVASTEDAEVPQEAPSESVGGVELGSDAREGGPQELRLAI